MNAIPGIIIVLIMLWNRIFHNTYWWNLLL